MAIMIMCDPIIMVGKTKLFRRGEVVLSQELHCPATLQVDGYFAKNALPKGEKITIFPTGNKKWDNRWVGKNFHPTRWQVEAVDGIAHLGATFSIADLVWINPVDTLTKTINMLSNEQIESVAKFVRGIKKRKKLKAED